jgi:hypothetical protein
MVVPAGGQRGTNVGFRIGGNFDRWPLSVHVSGVGLVATPNPDKGYKGYFTVQIAPDADLGLHWLRFYDEEGAAQLRPFLVGTLPELEEVEPNDDWKKPQTVAPAAGLVVNGTLGKEGDVDCFAVSLKKGQTLVAYLEAHHHLGSPIDCTLQLLGPDGRLLEQNDDYLGLDPRLVHQASQDGVYVVRTMGFPYPQAADIKFFGSSSCVYRLTLTTAGFADHAFPLAVSRNQPEPVTVVGWNLPEEANRVRVPIVAEKDRVLVQAPGAANPVWVRVEDHPTLVEVEPNDHDTPQAVELPATVSGRLDRANDLDVYRFTLKKGQRAKFEIEARALGSPADITLRLVDSSGAFFVDADDNDDERDPVLYHTAQLDGEHRLEVRELNGKASPGSFYCLRMLLGEHDYALRLASDRFAVARSKPLEIPVTLQRRGQANYQIEVGVEGLPEGVRCESAVWPDKRPPDQPVVVKLHSERNAAWSGPIRVVGRVKDQPALTRSAIATIPESNRPTPHVWLTVLKN